LRRKVPLAVSGWMGGMVLGAMEGMTLGRTETGCAGKGHWRSVLQVPIR
jgi:hypothetical protein